MSPIVPGLKLALPFREGFWNFSRKRVGPSNPSNDGEWGRPARHPCLACPRRSTVHSPQFQEAAVGTREHEARTTYLHMYLGT